MTPERFAEIQRRLLKECSTSASVMIVLKEMLEHETVIVEERIRRAYQAAMLDECGPQIADAVIVFAEAKLRGQIA